MAGVPRQDHQDLQDNGGEELEEVNFSIFGMPFTLSCRTGQQKEQLLAAVEAVRTQTARLLRENPTLTPQQTAVLTAVQTQGMLQAYLHSSTPFQLRAGNTINAIRTTLRRALSARR